MRAHEILSALRSKGHAVAIDTSGEVRITYLTPPRNQAKADELISAAQIDLKRILETEQNPIVQQALSVFPGARVVGVRMRA